MKMVKGLVVHKDGDVWHASLDRPGKLNALDAELVEAIIVMLQEARNEGITMLVLRGAGRNFSAGFDLSGLDLLTDADLLWRFVRIEQMLQTLAQSPFATVGFAHGRNFGAGVDLFAMCRYRVAAPQTTFRLPGLKFGLVLGTGRLVALLGAEPARSLLEDARTFGVQEARELAFVHQEAPENEWESIILQRADTARALSPEARRRLYDLSSLCNADRDLSELVRSAANPGLKKRIQNYMTDLEPKPQRLNHPSHKT